MTSLPAALAAVAALAIAAGCLSPATPDLAGAGIDPLDDPVCHGTLAGVDLHRATVREVQAALAAGTITSVGLVDAHLARIDAFDRAGPTLNSIIAVNPNARGQAAALDAERAAGHVRGPLHGVTVVMKDVIGTSDHPTTAGSIALDGNVPPEDSTVAARLRDAGAVILGKANLNEFSNWMGFSMPMGYSSLGGQTLNAYTLGDPGGSSAGSGVAASMAFANVAIGTDTTGSVTFPSNMNGVAGLRPTHALVSHAGIIPIIPHFDVAGPMGRHVEDVAVTLGAIAGPDPRDPFTATAAGRVPAGNDYTSFLDADALRGARLGYEADTDTAAFARVRGELEGLGATLVPIDSDSAALSQLATGGIAGFAANEFKFSINRYLAQEAGPGLPVETLSDIIAYNEQHPDKVKYGQEFLILSDATPGRRELTDAGAGPLRAQARATAEALFAAYDLDAIVGVTAGITPYSAFGAAAGIPNMALPAGFDGQQPYGLNFIGPEWSDPQLLGFAYAYEQATQHRRTPETVNPVLLDGTCTGTLAPIAEGPEWDADRH